jgi:hypothetical protein
MTTMTVKTLIATVAVTAALATPALSQTRNQVRPYDPSVYGRDLSGYGSYGAFDRSREQRSIQPRNDVYDQHGSYIGSDPDPRVRDQLRRDPSQGD